MFQEGAETFHKATSKRSVVIRMNEDGTVKVRTEDDEERDYFPQELKTLAEVEAESAAFIGGGPVLFDPYN